MNKKFNFIILVGTLAQRYGVSTLRLHSFLKRLSATLELDAEFLITPSNILYIFQQPGQSQFYHLEPAGASSFEMDKITQLGNLVNQLEAGTVDFNQADDALKAIEKKAPIFGVWPVGLGYVLSGMGFALILSVSWMDVGISALLSAVVYGLVLLSGRLNWLSQSLEFTAALVAGILASAIAWFFPGSNTFFTTLCGLVVLIPGLGITLGIGELMTNMISSGAQRLMSAIIVTLKLFLGAMIGTHIVGWIHPVPLVAEVAVTSWLWPWIAVAGLMVGLAVIFQVPRKDIIWTIAGGLLAWAGIVVGKHFGYWQGSFIAATTLGTFAYLYNRITLKPSSIVMLTGIMVLVPGAAAFIGLSTGPDGVSEAEWRAFVNAIAIIAGLIVPYSALPRRVTL